MKEPGEIKTTKEEMESDDEGEMEKTKGDKGQTDEPKVKQVTFQQEEDHIAETPRKKPRKRMKGIIKQLKAQMEFYFGDSNMSKDRFMKQEIEKSSEGYLPLSTFLAFNKIKTLTEEIEILAKALQSSEFLELNEDRTKVRRKTPVRYLTEEEVDARTVYVEGLRKQTTHEWVSRKFSVCGKVTYISLPRFKSTNDIKGFAFVEFESPEEAAKAIEMLNHVPEEKDERLEEKVGGSVKQSNNLKYLRKRAAKEGIDVEELEARLKESAAAAEGVEKGSKKSKSKKKKKKPPASQEEGLAKPVGASATNTDKLVADAKDLEVSSEADGTKRAKKPKKSKKKRKRGSVLLGQATENVAAEVSKTAGDSDSATKELKKAGDCLQIAREVSKSSEDNVSKSKKSEKGEGPSVSEGQGSRKRQRPAEESSQPRAAKVPKKDLPSDTDSTVRLEEKDGEHSAKDGDNSAKDGKDSTDNSKESAKEGQESAKDKKGSDKEGNVSATELEPQKDSSRKRKKDISDNFQDKDPKVKKPKTDKQSGQTRRSLDQPDANSAGEGRKRKRRSVEAHDDGSRKKMKRNSFSAREDAEAKVEEEGGKKKRFRRKYLPEEPLKLRVMSKKEWSALKEEYLDQQRTNMKNLKEQLRTAARNKKKKNKQNDGDAENGQETKSGHPAPEFVPNAIVLVKSDVGMCHESLKADVAPSIEVAYIDVRPGMTVGHIRCKNAESAAKLVRAGIKGCTVSLVEGEAEKVYWDKLINDRETRLSSKKRPKRRGKNKLLQRAQNPLGEIFRGQHLKFNDDDETHPGQMEDEFNSYAQL